MYSSVKNLPYKPVTLYQTKDGKLHNSTDKARQHAVNSVCEEIDKLVTGAQVVGVSRADIFKIVSHLAGDLTRVRLLHNLTDIFHDIGEEE